MPSEPNEMDQLASLEWYINKWETPYGDSTVPFSSAIRGWMSPAMRLRSKQVAARALAPIMARRARRLAASSPLRLHLGSGTNHLEGWVNIDLVGKAADLVWDIRRQLPFQPGSVDAVFIEHVLSQIPYSQGLAVLRESRRVLAVGGIIRVGCCDAGHYARSYVDDPDGFLDRYGRPTRMLALREGFQECGQVTAYDEDTLRLMFEAAGFPDADIMAPGESRLDPVPDQMAMKAESIYAESVVRGDSLVN